MKESKCYFGGMCDGDDCPFQKYIDDMEDDMIKYAKIAVLEKARENICTLFAEKFNDRACGIDYSVATIMKDVDDLIYEMILNLKGLTMYF